MTLDDAIKSLRRSGWRKAVLDALRQPPGDAEVWRCPCCKQIVDRAVMAAASS